MNITINKSELAILDKLPLLELIEDGKHCKILYQDRAFMIGRFLFQIIEQLQKGKSFENVVDEIHENGDYGINKEKLQSLLIEKLESFNLQLSDTNSKRRSDYISLKTQIANERVVGIFSNAFAFLFNRKVFAFVILLIISAQVLYAVYGPEVPALFSLDNLSTKNIIIVYLLSIMVMLFHELGHASAAKFFGVPPKGIGFGFYLIFPVFYADVTAVWRIDKYKRIIVNIGGVYFQAISNLFFITYLCLFSTYSVTLTTICIFLYKINIAVIVYSLSPYFRNDGYWIYSDYFDLPNLSQRAYAYPKAVFESFKKRLSGESKLAFFYKKISSELALFVFSITNYMVMIFFLIMLCRIIFTTALEVFNEVIVLDHDFDSKLMFKTVFLIIAICLLMYRFRGPLAKLFAGKKEVTSSLSNA